MKPKKQFKLLRPHRLRLILRELAQLVKVPDSPYKEWMFRCDPAKQSKKDAKAQDTFWNERRDELAKEFANIAKVKFEKVSRTTVKREVVVSVKSSSRSKRGKFEFKPIDKETVDKMMDEEEKRPKYKESTLHKAMLRLFQDQGVVTVQCLKDSLSDRGIPLEKFDQVLSDIAIEIPTQERYVLRRIKDNKEKEFQELRYIFIHLFSQTGVIRRKDVKETCEKCFGDAKHLTASRYSKLTQEFATSVGSRWHLKTGNEDNIASVVDLTKLE